jgi:hypothetical protein
MHTNDLTRASGASLWPKVDLLPVAAEHIAGRCAHHDRLRLALALPRPETVPAEERPDGPVPSVGFAFRDPHSKYPDRIVLIR